jgi:hypothetical protein
MFDIPSTTSLILLAKMGRYACLQGQRAAVYSNITSCVLCVHVCVLTHVCMPVYMQAHTHVYYVLFVYVHALSACKHVLKCVHVPAFACKCVHMCIVHCVYVYMFHVCKFMHKGVCGHVCACAYGCVAIGVEGG